MEKDITTGISIVLPPNTTIPPMPPTYTVNLLKPRRRKKRKELKNTMISLMINQRKEEDLCSWRNSSTSEDHAHSPLLWLLIISVLLCSRDTLDNGGENGGKDMVENGEEDIVHFCSSFSLFGISALGLWLFLFSVVAVVEERENSWWINSLMIIVMSKIRMVLELLWEEKEVLEESSSIFKHKDKEIWILPSRCLLSTRISINLICNSTSMWINRSMKLWFQEKPD